MPPRSLRKAQQESEDLGDVQFNVKKEPTKPKDPTVKKSAVKVEFRDLPLQEEGKEKQDLFVEGAILSLEDLESQHESFFDSLDLDKASFIPTSVVDKEEPEEAVEMDEWESLLLRKGNYLSDAALANEALDLEEPPIVPTDQQLERMKKAHQTLIESRASVVVKKEILVQQIKQTEENLLSEQEKLDFFSSLLNRIEIFFLQIDEHCIDEKIEAQESFEPVCDLTEFLLPFEEWNAKYPDSFDRLSIMDELELLVRKYFKTPTHDWRAAFKSLAT